MYYFFYSNITIYLDGAISNLNIVKIFIMPHFYNEFKRLNGVPMIHKSIHFSPYVPIKV